MRISDWSSDVCSSDLRLSLARQKLNRRPKNSIVLRSNESNLSTPAKSDARSLLAIFLSYTSSDSLRDIAIKIFRSEEHTSELQSRMHISYAVFCLKKNRKIRDNKISKT